MTYYKLYVKDNLHEQQWVKIMARNNIEFFAVNIFDRNQFEPYAFILDLKRCLC